MTQPAASERGAFGRPTVIAMLAAFGDRAPGSVDDAIGSLELTWLITEVEQRYGVVVELTDEELAAIRTVDDAAGALRGVLGQPDSEGANTSAVTVAEAVSRREAERH
ncbi:MAG TPA: acyl carrier protein [Actinocrinis sp.]